jgi:O-antigen/teichoic acid export membrane protein
MGGQGVSFLLQIGSTAILARLLMPEQFGLIGMVAAFTGFAQIFKDLGLSQATVQQKDLTHEKVSNLFWINVCFGLLAAIVVASLSPLIAWFYGDVRLKNITIALSLSFFFSGLGVQHQALLSRKMCFNHLTMIGIIAMFLGSLTGIIMALMGFDYWSLVMKNISTSFYVTAGTWYMCRWIPGSPSRRAGIGSMLKFGADITGFNIVNYFSKNIDNILIGRFWGASALGLYDRAYRLMYLPMQRFRFPMTKVAFPALSALQNDPEKYRTYFKKLNEILAFVCMPLVMYLGIYSENIIRLILGEKWTEAAVIFRILAISAFILPVISTPDLVLQTFGLTRRYLIWGLVSSFITVIAIFIGISWGAVGVATAYTIRMYVIFFPSLWYRFRDTPISVSLFLQSIYIPLFSSVIMGLLLILMSQYVVFKSNVSEIFVSLLFAATIYFGLWLVIPMGRKKLIEYYSYHKLLFGT